MMVRHTRKIGITGSGSCRPIHLARARFRCARARASSRPSPLAVTAFIFSILFITNASRCFAGALSSGELINNAKQYDGQEVVYRGEVIGEIMRRPPYAWININDGKNALGVWVEAALLKDIAYTGNYKAEGDIVEVAGVFHRACAQHGGDLDIHANQISLIERGRNIAYNIDTAQKQTALLLLGVLIFAWILNLLRRK